MDAADRLALEHLSVPRASPAQLVELAAANACRAACVLLAPLGAFPQTAGIDLVHDAPARRALRDAARREGVALPLAYPFVLSPRTGAQALQPLLEAAAQIGATGVGLLAYDREPARLDAELAAFCALATPLGLNPVLEFFGGSAVTSLTQAQALASRLAPLRLSLCIDALHLMRTGGGLAALADADGALIAHGQLCDGPTAPVLTLEEEAITGRLAPGEGDFDLDRFVALLPAAAWLGVEVPPPPGGEEPPATRAAALIACARATLSSGGS